MAQLVTQRIPQAVRQTLASQPKGLLALRRSHTLRALYSPSHRSRKPDLTCKVGLLNFAWRRMTGTSAFTVKPEEKWWNDQTLAVVTGANKGIGKAAAQILAQNGLITIVAARDEGRGKEAVKDLQEATGSKQIFFEQLDISDPASVKAFAKAVQDKHKEVSIVINNAGIAFKGNIFGADEAKQTIDTNFEGTRSVCEALIPLMANPGRIVNVCSMAGKQKQIKDPQLLKRFQEAKSAEEVTTLANEFLQGIRDNTFKEKGWPGSMYGISKLCEATYTRVLAEQLKSKGIDVNACCPGWVDTDMSSHRGIKTPAEGADTPVWLSLLAKQGTTAKFFSDRSEESF